jgi:hypothetical protein
VLHNFYFKEWTKDQLLIPFSSRQERPHPTFLFVLLVHMNIFTWEKKEDLQRNCLSDKRKWPIIQIGSFKNWRNEDKNHSWSHQFQNPEGASQCHTHPHFYPFPHKGWCHQSQSSLWIKNWEITWGQGNWVFYSPSLEWLALSSIE